jgi:hypothetical protein
MVCHLGYSRSTGNGNVFTCRDQVPAVPVLLADHGQVSWKRQVLCETCVVYHGRFASWTNNIIGPWFAYYMYPNPVRVNSVGFHKKSKAEKM